MKTKIDNTEKEALNKNDVNKCIFMEQWTIPDCGTVRISNPKTLKKWIDLGWYKEMINDGYVFNPYCGRFRTENCNCSACKSKRLDKSKLIEILEKL